MRARVFLAVLFLSSQRHLVAQTSLGVAAGATIPAGSEARIDNTGYHLLGTLQTMPPFQSIGLRFDASYAAMTRKATIQDITERLFSLSVGPVLRYPRIGGSFKYVVAMAGAYTQTTSPRPIGSTPSTDLGVSLGGGLRFAVKSRVAFVEARYHRIMSDGGPRFVPVTFGLLF